MISEISAPMLCNILQQNLNIPLIIYNLLRIIHLDKKKKLNLMQLDVKLFLLSCSFRSSNEMNHLCVLCFLSQPVKQQRRPGTARVSSLLQPPASLGWACKRRSKSSMCPLSAPRRFRRYKLRLCWCRPAEPLSLFYNVMFARSFQRRCSAYMSGDVGFNRLLQKDFSKFKIFWDETLSLWI